MSHDSFPEQYTSDSFVRLPEPDHDVDRLEGIDESFVFDFQAYDEVADGQRWTTWYDVEPLSRGPEPRPDWVVTSRGAIDTELGILKTGKEADVFLLERADLLEPRARGRDGGQALPQQRAPHLPPRRVVHRGPEHEALARRAGDQAQEHLRQAGRGRRVGGLGVGRAGSGFWALGLPVPYPVQIDGTEILMEWITVETGDGVDTAPRLAQARPEPALLASYFDQLRDALATMVQHGIVHGDLSPYNILAAGERLVIIDLPQIVDLVGNLNGMDFLLRDCTNICTWFRARGLDVDEHDLFGELLGHAF